MIIIKYGGLPSIPKSCGKPGALTPVWLIYYATSLFMKEAIVILNGISNFNYGCLSHSYRGWRVVHGNIQYNELGD